MKLTHFGMDTHTVFTFSNPDKKCSFLKDSQMIWVLLFSIKAHGSTSGLILLVEIASKPMKQGGYIILYLKQHESEAVEKLSNLSAFFLHHFGSESLEHFSQDAVNQAEQMIWDKEMDRPISLEEQYLEDIAGEDLAWVKNLDDVKFTTDAVAAVVLDCPQQLQVPQPVLLENADANTVKTFFPNQVVTQVHNDQVSFDATADDVNGQAGPTPEASSAGASLEALVPGA
jgi:hypothetical protein